MSESETVLGIMADALYTNDINQLVFSGDVQNLFDRFKNDSRFSSVYKSDGRSAGYFTMGLSQRGSNIVWLFCGGNNASSVDVLPAITEAQNQNVPIVVCSVGSNEFVGNVCNLLSDKCNASIDIDLDQLTSSSELLSTIYYIIASASEFDKGPVFLSIKGNYKREIIHTEEIKKVSIITQEQFCNTIEKTKSLLKKSKICVFFDPFTKYDEEMIEVVCSFLRWYDVTFSRFDVYKLLPYANNTIDHGVTYDILISFTDRLSYDMVHEQSQIKAREKWLVSLSGCSQNNHYGFNTFIICNSHFFLKQLSEIHEPIVSKKYIDNNCNKTFFEKVLNRLVSSFDGNVNIFSGFDTRHVTSRVISQHPNTSTACYTSLESGDGILSILLGQSIVYERIINVCVLSVSEFLRDMNSIHIRHYRDNVRIIVVAKKDEKDSVRRLKSWLLDYKIQSLEISDEESLEGVIRTVIKRDGLVYAAFIEIEEDEICQ